MSSTSTIDDQIALKQQEIDAIKGNVPGVTPADCNIAELNTQITTKTGELSQLLIQKAQEQAEFTGLTFVLKLANNTNDPSLSVNNRNLANTILASGQRSIDINGVNVAAAGTTVTLTVASGTSIEKADTLNIFSVDKGFYVDTNNANSTVAANQASAEKYQQTAEDQQLVINEFDGSQQFTLTITQSSFSEVQANTVTNLSMTTNNPSGSTTLVVGKFTATADGSTVEQSLLGFQSNQSGTWTSFNIDSDYINSISAGGAPVTDGQTTQFRINVDTSLVGQELNIGFGWYKVSGGAIVEPTVGETVFDLGIIQDAPADR